MKMPSYWPQLLRMKGHRYRKEFCISALPLVSPELGVISAEARVGILESLALVMISPNHAIRTQNTLLTFATHKTLSSLIRQLGE